MACVLLDSSRARCSCRAACLLPPLHRALPRVPRACIRLRATWHGDAADCAHAVQCKYDKAMTQMCKSALPGGAAAQEQSALFDGNKSDVKERLARSQLDFGSGKFGEEKMLHQMLQG